MADTYRFAPSTGTFYPDDVVYETVPPDAVSCSAETFAECMNRPLGSVIRVIAGTVQVVPAPPPTLDDVKAAKIAALRADYLIAITAPVTYTTAAGTTASFGQDVTSTDNLEKCLLASQKSKKWPLNLWLDVGGAPVSPFTFEDLQGLAEAMGAQDTPVYTRLLTAIAAVQAASNVDAVTAITL